MESPRRTSYKLWSARWALNPYSKWEAGAWTVGFLHPWCSFHVSIVVGTRFMGKLDGAFHRSNECHHQVVHIVEELWGRHMQWSSEDQIWSRSEWLCSAFLGAGAYHMTMTGKWISFGLPKYLCIVRIDFDFAAVSFGAFGLWATPKDLASFIYGFHESKEICQTSLWHFFAPTSCPALWFRFRHAVDILIWQPSMAI